MAKLVDVLCVPHDPTLPPLRHAGAGAPEPLQRIPVLFDELSTRLAAAQPDVLVVASGDHLNQWFLDNMPTFAVGKAPRASGPFSYELELFPIDPYSTAVHAELARHLLHGGLDNAFDLSWSDDFQIDHGFTVPLNYLRPDQDLPIVPVFTNILVPPIASGYRFYELGELVARLIAEWDSDERVAVIASGHMTNAIGGPAMARFVEEPETEWDRDTWAKLTTGRVAELLPGCSWEKLYEQGNGTPGFLLNVFGAGAAGGRVPSFSELVASRFGPACAFVEWNEQTLEGRAA
jgi:protocatechuate 4,5-dioxygenase beta chain